VAALANTTSYELTSTVQELDELRDTSGRPRLERLAVELLAKDARKAARAQDLEATLTARPIQGALDTEMGDEERSALRPMMILKVTLICWFAILRSGMFGLGAGGCAVAFQSLAKKVYKAELPDGTSRPPAWGDWHFYAYWVINGLLPTIVSFAESILIYFDLLKVSLAVAATSGIKLYPLDPVRVFVCNSIVAEVFELGHPSEPRFGINPLRGSNEYILKLYEMLYSLRGGALKFIIKVCPLLRARTQPSLIAPHFRSFCLRRWRRVPRYAAPPRALATGSRSASAGTWTPRRRPCSCTPFASWRWGGRASFPSSTCCSACTRRLRTTWHSAQTSRRRLAW